MIVSHAYSVYKHKRGCDHGQEQSSVQEGYSLLESMRDYGTEDAFKTRSIGDWANQHLKEGSIILSDGLACFKAVKEAECEHLGFVVVGKLELLDHKAFNWVNTMIGNVKIHFEATAIQSEQSICQDETSG